MLTMQPTGTTDPTKGGGLLSQLSTAMAQGLQKKRKKRGGTATDMGVSQDLTQAAMNPNKGPGTQAGNY